MKQLIKFKKKWYNWYTGRINITINDLISEDLLDNYTLCIESYKSAYNYKEVKEEVAANYIALIIFVSKIKDLFDKETLYLYLNKLKEPFSDNSMFKHLKTSLKETKLVDNMKMNRLIVASDKNFLQIIKSEGITEWLFQKVFDKETYEDMMKTLYQSNIYKELGYYYEALYYLFDIINNDKDKMDNYRTGFEMLCLFARHGNNYAKAYLEYQLQLDESDYT